MSYYSLGLLGSFRTYINLRGICNRGFQAWLSPQTRTDDTPLSIRMLPLCSSQEARYTRHVTASPVRRTLRHSSVKRCFKVGRTQGRILVKRQAALSIFNGFSQSVQRNARKNIKFLTKISFILLFVIKMMLPKA